MRKLLADLRWLWNRMMHRYEWIEGLCVTFRLAWKGARRQWRREREMIEYMRSPEFGPHYKRIMAQLDEDLKRRRKLQEEKNLTG